MPTLLRSLLLFILIAGCGPTHLTGGPSDGHLGAADALAPIDGDDGSNAGSATCTLASCATQNAMCGPVGDGCGGAIDCGGCTTPETCGGGGDHFTCGGTGAGSACTPRTCAQAGATCGVVADGCAGLTASCGTCGAGETCGAGSIPNTCASDTTCVAGLCLQQNACPMMPKTSISGTITAPGHDNTAVWGTPDPIYGALVYVPNGAVGAPTYGVMPFATGVSCDSCSSLVTGNPLVSVTRRRRQVQARQRAVRDQHPARDPARSLAPADHDPRGRVLRGQRADECADPLAARSCRRRR